MKERGPFLRLKSEGIDENAELHLKLVPEDERNMASTDMFRARVRELVKNAILWDEYDLRIRGVDRNSPDSVEMIKLVIREVISSFSGKNTSADLRARLGALDKEALLRKFLAHESRRAMSKESLESGSYYLNANRVQ